MSDSSSGEARSSARRERTQASDGVLANLPRTRPQRSSARRDASRKAAAAQATQATRTRTPKRKQTTTAKPGPAKSKRTAKRPQDPAPRQGFESEGDPVSGPVQPPGGVELLASAAELAGELAKTGLASGGRLLKDFLARLPLN